MYVLFLHLVICLLHQVILLDQSLSHTNHSKGMVCADKRPRRHYCQKRIFKSVVFAITHRQLTNLSVLFQLGSSGFTGRNTGSASPEPTSRAGTTARSTVI